MLSLLKGQRVRLSEFLPAASRDLEVRLAIEGLSERLIFLCFPLDSQGVLASGLPAVHARQPEAPGLSALPSASPHSAAFRLRLEQIPETVQKIAFAFAFTEEQGFSPEKARHLRQGQFSLRPGGASADTANFNFSGTDFGDEKAVALAELYRKDDHWRLALTASGFNAGLRSLCDLYRCPLPVAPINQPSPPPSRSSSPPATPPGGAFSPAQLPAHWPAAQPPQLPRDILPAVGLVHIVLNDGSHATGTAFAITPGGHLLTCHHVAEDAALIEVRMEGAKTFRPARLLATHEPLDLALLHLSDGSGCERWTLLAPHEDTPQLGDEIGLFGYPLGNELGTAVTYSQGIVNSHRSLGDRPVLQIDAGSAPGSSGGPVFRRRDGRIVAMLQAGVNRGDRGMIANLALDLRVLHTLGWIQ